MKRILFALLLVPTIAGAQEGWLVDEQWTTYCESGVEKIRAELTLDLVPGIIIDDNSGGELFICAAPEGCYSNPTPTVTDLGGGLYRWNWEGWPRDCYQTEVSREGVLVFRAPWGDYMWLSIHCSDGPQAIIDTVECIPLPVAQPTWGAVKAMYR